jgi:hypothetical protein
MPAVERHFAVSEYGLLGGMLQRRFVGVRRAPLPGQGAGGIDVGKIGADRFAVAVDQSVGQRGPADHRRHADAEQDQAIAARTRSAQPVAGSQALSEMSHFATEFL